MGQNSVDRLALGHLGPPTDPFESYEPGSLPGGAPDRPAAVSRARQVVASVPPGAIGRRTSPWVSGGQDPASVLTCRETAVFRGFPGMKIACRTVLYSFRPKEREVGRQGVAGVI